MEHKPKRKKKKKKKVSIDFDKDGRRRGVIPFLGEDIPLLGLIWEEEEDLNAKYKINEINNRIAHYQTRLQEPGIDEKLVLLMEDVLADLYTNLYTEGDKAATEKVKIMIQKPDEWFKKLTLQELNALKLKIMSWMMFVDIDDLYMEMFKEATDFFGQTKRKSEFKGDEVSAYMEKLERDYLSLKKKPKCLSTALRNVQEAIVQDVFTDLQIGENTSLE